MSERAVQEARDNLLRVMGNMLLHLVEQESTDPTKIDEFKKEWGEAGVKMFAAIRGED